MKYTAHLKIRDEQFQPNATAHELLSKFAGKPNVFAADIEAASLIEAGEHAIANAATLFGVPVLPAHEIVVLPYGSTGQTEWVSAAPDGSHRLGYWMKP